MSSGRKGDGYGVEIYGGRKCPHVDFNYGTQVKKGKVFVHCRIAQILV